MDHLAQLFSIAKKSIGSLNNLELGNELRLLNSYTKNDLSGWSKRMAECSVQPDPILPYDNVERFFIVIPGSRYAFMDIHEINDIVGYIKIFFLLKYIKLLQTKSIKKI